MSELEEMAEAIKMHQEMLKQASSNADTISVKTTCSAQKALQDEQQEFLSNIIKELTDSKEFLPHLIIQKGLTAFTKVEARAFVIHNILESVKGGKGLTDTLKEYSKLGLTTVQPEQLKPTADGTQPKNGTFLFGLWKSLKQAAGIIIGIIVNAFKVATEMAGVEPSIGLAAGFPTISFKIEAKSPSFGKIWEILEPAFNAKNA